MAEKRNEQASEASYELDLDDTISSWDQLVEEAVAAVDRADETEPPDGRAEESPAGETAADEETEADEETIELPDAEAKDEQAAAPAAEREEDAEVKNLRDRLLRTLADFDNFRKRTERERAATERYALFDVLKDFLDVFDNLERAVAASGSAEDLKTGVEMIVRQFSELLRRYGVEVIDALGQTFDPTVHEAVTTEVSAEVEEPTVTSQHQRGYRLHERLLRPAMVGVAMPAPVAEPAAVAEEGAEPQAEEPPLEVQEVDGGDGESVGQATEMN